MSKSPTPAARGGSVTAEPRGRFTYYRLLPDAIEAVAAGLATHAHTNTESFREC